MIALERETVHLSHPAKAIEYGFVPLMAWNHLRYLHPIG
jgi:hypothetical protein